MYPEKHKEIVNSLLQGKFITVDRGPMFDIVKKNEDFYTKFFEQSFGFELIENQSFYYLVSNNTEETTSRNITIFFSILCYELEKNEKNFLQELNYSTFHIDQIIEYFNKPSWTYITKANKQFKNDESIKKLVKTMLKRNIVVKQNNDTFTFTKAHKLFIDYVKDFKDLIKETKDEKNEPSYDTTIE